MHNLKHIRILTAVALVFSGASAFATEYTVSPGGLADLLAGSPAIADGNLTVRGRIDARDIFALRGLGSEVTAIDLSGTTVEGYTSPAILLEGRLSYPASTIPDFAFFGSSVSTLSLPAGVVTIGEGAFSGTALRQVDLPAGLVSLGDYAFHDCQSLERVTLPSSVAVLGTGVFGRCVSLASVSLSGTAVHVIPERCFYGCSSLTEVAFPSSLSDIGREAFSGTAIETMNLPQVRNTSPFALSGMKNLKSVTLPSSANYADGLLMGDIALTSVSNTPLDIPALFVAGCTAYDAASLLKGASSVESFALAGVPVMKIMLGKTLAYVGVDAFAGLPMLNTIDAVELGGTVPDVAEGAFDAMDPSGISLYVRREHIQTWRDHPEWGKFRIIPDDDIVTAIGDDARDTEVTCTLVDGGVMVKATSQITLVAVYSVDGMLLGSASPGVGEYLLSLSLPQGKPVVVRVDAGNVSRITKLM